MSPAAPDPAPLPPPSPERLASIMDGAFQAFATYGFRRTTMDDIARGAGLSRTALYLHFRSKEDIFLSLVQHFFQTAVADMTAALSQPHQTVEQALMAAFLAKDGKLMETVLSTPHGAELMDAGFNISADLATEFDTRLKQILADWFAARGLPDGVGTPAEVAETLMAALKGLKSSIRTIEDYRAGEARLARLFGRALS